MEWYPPPQDIYVLIPRTLWIYYFTWQRGICRCDLVKDLEFERLSWTLQVGPIWLKKKKVHIRGMQGGSESEDDEMLEAQGEKMMWQWNESWEWCGAMSQEIWWKRSLLIATNIYITFFLWHYIWFYQYSGFLFFTKFSLYIIYKYKLKKLIFQK